MKTSLLEQLIEISSVASSQWKAKVSKANSIWEADQQGMQGKIFSHLWEETQCCIQSISSTGIVSVNETVCGEAFTGPEALNP